MKLKDNPEIKKIPRFSGGSYSKNDRIYLPHNQIYLSEVKISHSSDLLLIVRPIDGGPEQWTDFLKLRMPDKDKINTLFDWLNKQIGKTIDSIFRSEFSF